MTLRILEGSTFCICDDLGDFVVLTNQGMERVAFTLELEVGCDFADIMAVKAYDFALGDPLGAPPLPALVPPSYDGANRQFVLVDGEEAQGVGARTHVVLSRPGEVDGDRVTYAVE